MSCTRNSQAGVGWIKTHIQKNEVQSQLKINDQADVDNIFPMHQLLRNIFCQSSYKTNL